MFILEGALNASAPNSMLSSNLSTGLGGMGSSLGLAGVGGGFVPFVENKDKNARTKNNPMTLTETPIMLFCFFVIVSSRNG